MLGEEALSGVGAPSVRLRVGHGVGVLVLGPGVGGPLRKQRRLVGDKIVQRQIVDAHCCEVEHVLFLLLFLLPLDHERGVRG